MCLAAVDAAGFASRQLVAELWCGGAWTPELEGIIEMASRAMHDGRSVVTTCGGCYADCAFAAHVEDGRVVAELPVPGHPCAARALCAADGIAW